MNRILSAGLAAAATAALLVDPAVAVAASPPKACVAGPLPEAPDWASSNVDSADPTGRYVAGGGFDGVSFDHFTALWDNGQLREVTIPGTQQVINDVNSSGTAVAQSVIENTFDFMTPWVIADGRATALPGMASGSATGINERGDVVGYGNGDAVIWKVGSTWPQKLERPPGAKRAGATDIDDDGTVLGWFDRDGQRGVVVWRPDGRIVELGSPLGPSSVVLASRLRHGWVAGATLGSGRGTAVRWNLADGTATTYPHLGFASSVNSSGAIVGQQAERDYLAVYVTDAGEMLLPGLVAPVAGTEVRSVSDDGRRLAGRAADLDGNGHAVIWTCE